MEAAEYDIAVIGAGIIGAAASYYLSKKYRRVLLLEKSFPASGASGACNGGLSCLGKEGVLLDQAVESLALYRGLEQELGARVEIDLNRKIFFYADSPARMEVLERAVRQCVQRGVEAELLNAGGVSAFLPSSLLELAGGAAASGGFHGIANPYSVIGSYIAGLKRNGGAVIRNREVVGFACEGDTITGVRTGSQLFRVSAALLCTGFEELLPEGAAGCEVKPVRGTVLVTGRSSLQLPANILSAAFLGRKESSGSKTEVHCAVEQTVHGNILIGSSSEPGRSDSSIDTDTVRALVEEVTSVLPALRKEKIVRIFSGVRPYRENGPFIGMVKPYTNLAAAAGFGGFGITLAPYAGREASKIFN